MSMQPNNERDGIQSLVTTLIWSGTSGLVVGLLCALALVRIGPDFMQASPGFTTFSVMLVFFLASTMFCSLINISTAAPARAWADGRARR